MNIATELIECLALAAVLLGGIALIGRYNDLDRIEHEREMREITLKMQKRATKWLHNTKKY